jgi:hypothetical protein
MSTILYEELEKHYHVPKTFMKQRGHFNYDKVPRKLKKELKKKNYNSWLSINVKMWLLMQEKNPNYHRFLIQQICKHYETVQTIKYK